MFLPEVARRAFANSTSRSAVSHLSRCSTLAALASTASCAVAVSIVKPSVGSCADWLASLTPVAVRRLGGCDDSFFQSTGGVGFQLKN